jgi:deoxyribonucleoside regulator
MANNRDELLAEIATLYYYHDQSQQDIADQLELSRSNISRMLKEARERGIVEIFIHHPLRRVTRLEQQLSKRFGLREVGVVQTIPGTDAATLARAAELAARLLDAALENVQVLGLGMGSSVSATVNAFAPRRRYDVEVVQLTGGIGLPEAMIDGPALVERMARRLTNRFRYLHAPLIVDSPTIARGLLEQRDVAGTLSLAGQSDIALVGVGTLRPDISSLLRAGYLSLGEFNALKASGVVGDICARHFDRYGHKAAPELADRVIAITLDELSAIPTVIGVACTVAKAEALLGALRGGYLDILVTDSAAAEAVLELADEPVAASSRG